MINNCLDTPLLKNIRAHNLSLFFSSPPPAEKQFLEQIDTKEIAFLLQKFIF